MSWVTVIWSMSASACLTLAVIYWLVWNRNRAAWAHLLFSVTAASTTAFTFCELWLMRVQTPEALVDVMKWAQLPFFFWLVSLTWFVWTYLGAGRRWLVWTITGMRLVFVLLHFLVGQLNYLELPHPRHIRFLGESVTVLGGGTTSPATLFGQLAVLLMLVFVADAGITTWRRGDRRRALTVAGSVEFFLIAGLATTSLVVWLHVEAPIMISPLYMGLVAVMGYELSRDVLRASQLVRELQASEAGLRESEARMSLAVDAADVGIWIRDLARNEIWASEKWRELFGFAPSEHVEFNAILRRLHPDDREGFVQALTMAGARGGRYQTEYRLLLPDGETRWISSMGRVEVEATGEPVLMRGASREVTARKHAELAVRNLSGRLLSAQEAERRRIARELHDNLSQRVALLAIEIEQVGMRSEPLSDVAGSMRQLGMRTAEISTEIHNLSHQLHSAKLDALGLEAAVRGHCRELRAQGLQVQCLAEKVPDALPYEVALCLFRVVQEGLNNVVKHSGAREAEVTLTGTEDALLVTIVDTGRGFDEASATVQRGLGLASMRERLHLIAGELTVRSDSGHGATIIARVPIADVGSNIADTVQVA
jgi:PAS domain S-box-containing protein